MRLVQAARRFDKTPCTDGYTGAAAFMGQLGLYDDNKRDSEAGERRTLSTAPGVAIPARRVIAAAGTRWIVGHGYPDAYKTDVIRMGYVAHEATVLAQVQTLGQLCRNEAGFTAWAAQAWIKNAADNSGSAVLTPQHNLHFALGEAVTETCIATLGSVHHVVRQVRQGPAGTLIAVADQLQEPVVETASMTTGTWDPIAQAMTGSATNVRVVRARWQSLYEYRNPSAPAFTADDMEIVIAKTALTAAPGQKLTLSDGVWLLETVTSRGDVWVCRAVHHG